MSGFLGADPEGLRSLARHMDSSAEQLDGLRKELGVRFQSVRWEGEDAHREKGTFRTVHARRMQHVALLLRETADLVRKNAQDQTAVSSTGHGVPIAQALPQRVELPQADGPLTSAPAENLMAWIDVDNFRRIPVHEALTDQD